MEHTHLTGEIAADPPHQNPNMEASAIAVHRDASPTILWRWCPYDLSPADADDSTYHK
jgi:hypothetical protein